ncbi:MAG: hypothetical protein ACI8T1_004227 [Verrucomicrobiales bacterium]
MKSDSLLVPRRQFGRIVVDELANHTRGDVQVVLSPQRLEGTAAFQASHFNALTEAQVSKENTPQLIDHQVQGIPAVPGVLVMEWFLKNAQQVAGPRGLLRCRDFQQLQGISIPDFGQGSVPFSIVMDSMSSFQSGGQSSMRLLDADGQLRYAGVLEKVTNVQALGLTEAPELELERTAWTESHVYGPGALFHGPAFQVIHRVEGVSPQGALGRLLQPERRRVARRWLPLSSCDDRWGDSARLCVGLFTQDSEFLVTSIGEFVQAPNANYNQALRCVLEGFDSSPEHLRLNAYLETDSRETLAVMRNIECHPTGQRSQS